MSEKGILAGMPKRLALAAASVFLIVALATPQDKVLVREDFNSLERWRPVYFPKIKKHTTYTIESRDGAHCLRAESNASASALAYREAYRIYEYPKLRWRWKVDNIYTKADPATKAGDDYPLRIYVMFGYDPEKASFFERVKHELARKIYGEYPPHSSLTYVWASREHLEEIVSSPYTEKAKMILLEQGSKNVGMWQEENVNVLEDYRKAFGTDPPALATIGIMNDSDNTGEHSVSYVGYIEVYR